MNTSPVLYVTVYADGSEYLMTQQVYWVGDNAVNIRGTASNYNPLAAAQRLVAARFDFAELGADLREIGAEVDELAFDAVAGHATGLHEHGLTFGGIALQVQV